MSPGRRGLVADDGGEHNRARSGARCRRENHVARRRCSKRAYRTPHHLGARGCKGEEQEQDCRRPRAHLAYLVVQVREREHDSSAHGASRDAQDGSDLAVRPPFEIRHVQHLPLACGERGKTCMNRVAVQGREQAVPDAGLGGHGTPILGQESSCFGVAPKSTSRIGWSALTRALTFGLDHAAHRVLTLEARLPRRNPPLVALIPGFPQPA